VWPISYEQFLEAPAELIDEWSVRIAARRKVEARLVKRQEAEAKRARR